MSYLCWGNSKSLIVSAQQLNLNSLNVHVSISKHLFVKFRASTESEQNYKPRIGVELKSLCYHICVNNLS